MITVKKICLEDKQERFEWDRATLNKKRIPRDLWSLESQRIAVTPAFPMECGHAMKRPENDFGI